jgi:hypothetical protein
MAVGQFEKPPRVSGRRIVGALLLVLGVLWVALPIWALLAEPEPGMQGGIPPRPLIFELWPYVGLIIILFGLGFLDIARGRWLPTAIVALVVWVVVLFNRPFG